MIHELSVNDILFDLIKIDSTEGKEIELVNYIEDSFENKGYKIIKQEVKKNSFNLLITKGNPKIFFFGHLDTVKSGNLEQWKITSPFSPIKIDNKIYGIGSVDMKSGIAALLSTVLEENPENIGICFTCDEEYNFLGIKKLIESDFLNNFKPKLGIFCEPTNLEIINTHRGCFEFKVKAIGKTAHAARPEQGIDASKLYLAITELRDTLKKEFGNVDLNIGYFNSGCLGSINKIPEEAEAVIDIRTPLKLSIKSSDHIITLLKEILNKFGIKSFYEIHFNMKPLEVMKEELEVLINVMNLLNFPIKFKEMDGTSESGEIHFNYKFPCVNLGPGPKESSHKSDEYVDFDSVIKCKKLYSELIKRYNQI